MKNLSGAVFWGLLIAGGSYVIFFQYWPGLVPASAAGVYGFFCARKRIRMRKKQRKLSEFRDFLAAMQGPLEAGETIEQALSSAVEDMERMYGTDYQILQGLRKMLRGLSNGKSFGEAVREFSQEENLEEIRNFSEIMTSLKTTGGNAIQILQSTASQILEEIQLKEELSVMTAAKELEQQMMTGMPAVVILFLRLISPDFMEPLFGTTTGVLLMTVVLGGNLAADAIGKKIVTF